MVVLPESSANILHNSQISFLRKKRTADHVFALTYNFTQTDNYLRIVKTRKDTLHSGIKKKIKKNMTPKRLAVAGKRDKGSKVDKSQRKAKTRPLFQQESFHSFSIRFGFLRVCPVCRVLNSKAFQ